MSELKGVDELLRKISQLESEAFDELAKTVKREGKKVQSTAKLLCSVDTGELRQSIKEETEISKEQIQSKVYTNKEHAPYIEFGTGPKGQENHAGISPDVNPMYRQTGWVYGIEEKGKTKFIFTRGQPAKPFMYPALYKREDKIVQTISNSLKKLFKRKGK